MLASRSPQRRALLAQIGIPFRVADPDYDEPSLAAPPDVVVRTHAMAKARSVDVQPGDGPILGVDTVVVLADGTLLGKPADAGEAAAMLGRLAGSDHRVLSGLALLDGSASFVEHAETVVRFRPLDRSAIADYVATGEWQGRAGGYAIQGRGAVLVSRIEGCYPNVVGLPIALLLDGLATIRRPIAAASPQPK